jgi:signal transduction histidine kinase
MRSLSYNILRAKNIEFTFRADEKLNEQKLSLEDRRNFYLIFKEILNNMVKYSEATRASIILNTENNFIVLSINDNGKGFDTSVASNGNGLNNIRRRAKEMKADLTIESSLGNGTRTELKFR